MLRSDPEKRLKLFIKITEQAKRGQKGNEGVFISRDFFPL